MFLKLTGVIRRFNVVASHKGWGSHQIVQTLELAALQLHIDEHFLFTSEMTTTPVSKPFQCANCI